MLGVDLYTYFLHIHAHDIKPRFPDKSSHVTCTLGRPPNRGDPTGATADISGQPRCNWGWVIHKIGWIIQYLINNSHENHKIQNVTSRYFSINLLIQPPLCLGCWKRPCGWLVKFWRWFGGTPFQRTTNLYIANWSSDLSEFTMGIVYGLYSGNIKG